VFSEAHNLIIWSRLFDKYEKYNARRETHPTPKKNTADEPHFPTTKLEVTPDGTRLIFILRLKQGARQFLNGTPFFQFGAAVGRDPPITQSVKKRNKEGRIYQSIELGFTLLLDSSTEKIVQSYGSRKCVNL
jgi:hypothetical protein